MRENRKKRLGDVSPKRIKYRKLKKETRITVFIFELYKVRN